VASKIVITEAMVIPLGAVLGTLMPLGIRRLAGGAPGPLAAEPRAPARRAQNRS
jgi:hypothetical protein